MNTYPTHAFRRTPAAAAVSAFALMLSAHAFAQNAAPAVPATTPPAAPPVTQLNEVVVTANPLGSDLNDLVAPVSTLQGDALTTRHASTLGETLNSMPGVTSTYFGPNASRPVIRGLDGDRIRILENGGTALDASALSYDHNTPIEPLAVARIEVVRGPAALLYGGSAIGGVVNVIDNRIPKEPIQGVNGAVETNFGGAEKERSAGALLEAGNGQFAVHADVFGRRTSDLRIPGFARSDRLRNAEPLPEGETEAKDRLVNSDARSAGGAFGAAYTTQTGYIGASASGYNSNYGTVAEEAVRIQMHQQRYAIEGEQRELGGFFDTVKAKFSYTDYEHKEIEDGELGTTFKNKGWDARVEGKHRKLGPLEGVIGVQVGQNKFSALGEEAFVPKTDTTQAALFVFEELPVDAAGNLKFNFGGRVERTQVKATADGNEKFFDDKRNFTATSGSVGLLYKLNPLFTLTSNLAYTERAPTFYELYANGPHVATNAFELGDPNAKKEKATSIDLGLRFKQGPNSGSVSAYYSRFSNYLALINTGNSVDFDEGPLPEMKYIGVPAVLYGFEAEGKVRLADKLLGSADTLDLELRGDTVRGKNRDTGEALPRLAPYRLASALVYTSGPWRARVDVSYNARQTHVPANDTPTDSYTMLGALISYSFKWSGTQSLVYLRGDNLTNTEARSASSILRDIAPLGGRSVKVGLKTMF